MNRRCFFALAGLGPVFAKTTPQAEVYKLFSDLASALSAGNAVAFMKWFDPKMEGYAKLEDDITALMAQDIVSASIEVVRNEGDAQRRTVDLDWYLVIISQQPTGPTVRRRQNVTCQLELRKKKWAIVSLKPLAFFTPPGRTR
jgi:hypothetical protein